jgi:hypothetical protein
MGLLYPDGAAAEDQFGDPSGRDASRDKPASVFPANVRLYPADGFSGPEALFCHISDGTGRGNREGGRGGPPGAPAAGPDL